MSASSSPRPARRASPWFALAAAAAVTAVPGPAGSARAALAGFGDFSGFTITRNDTNSPPTVSVPAGSIQLTNNSLGEARSVFANAPQPVGPFTASFTYTATNIGAGSSQGVAFVLQNAPAGPAAVGPANGQLGYQGITPSLALGISLPGSGNSRVGLFANGAVTGGAASTAPVDVYSNHPIDVAVSYPGGSFVGASMTDRVTGGSYATTFVLGQPLATQVGGPAAYVGFTASTDGVGSGSNQTISNFQFSSVPEPTAAAVGVLAPAVLLRRRRRAGGRAAPANRFARGE